MQNLILPLLILVLIFVAFVLPARRRQRTMSELQQAVRPGAKVRTVGGLVGTVVALNDQEVILELAPGFETRWLRAAIGAVLSDDDEFVPGGTVLEDDADDEIEGETADDELVEDDGDDDGEERAAEDEDGVEAAGDEPSGDDAGERDGRAAMAEGSDEAGAAEDEASRDEAAEDKDEPRRESALAAGGKKGRARTS